MMKPIKSLLLLLCLALLPCRLAAQETTSTMIAVNDATSVPLSDIIATGLPVLYVQTVNGEEPTCEYVYAPAGSMGATIRNATKVPGRMTIYQHIGGMDSLLYDSGDYVKSVSGMTIKIRGNTSAFEPKKPYKIKLQKKHDLLFRGVDSVYKDKDWVLIKDMHLMAKAGFKVGELLGMKWTPGHRYVALVVNDDYRGIYLLCESVERNPDCRLNVDKHSGYIFECDPYWWNEDVYVNSVTSPSYNFTFKYPESEDILPEQLEYVQTLVTAYENSLSTVNYPQWIDVPSFAAWCLARDLSGTKDSGGANRFYTKFDSTDTSKIVMPVLWDFDMDERMTGAWSRCHTDHFSKLFNNTNKEFVNEFVTLWHKVNKTFLSELSTYMYYFPITAEGKAVNACIVYERLKWGSTSLIDGKASARVAWYTERVKWINAAIEAMNPLGDVNINGVVNVSDVTALIDILLSGTSRYRYASDLDGDGEITIADVTLLIDKLLSQA